jgi:hypothetical protein
MIEKIFVSKPKGFIIDYQNGIYPKKQHVIIGGK